MIDQAMWLVTAASIIGTVANICKRRWCFYVWAATNATWAVYDLWKGAPAQAGLMAVYFGLSVWGIRAWRQEDKA
jgi:hypothetical protein